ncbi:hypothetical protein [Arthrobacter sp. lap29]|uniref:hypothetical protein n=1 Tax=Arthrobacter sp. lap29 TaxID=3056122 RepID=UPI0028F6CA27|nr:hypothetical protein [Arthrobacter sp. lap29]
MMTILKGCLLLATDPDQIALRSAVATERTADWTFWLAIGTFGLLAGAIIAAIFALLTWLSTKGQLEAATTQLALAKTARHQEEADNVSAWLAFDGTAMDIYVRNGNAGPVYDVTCLIEAKPNDTSSTPTAEIHRWVSMAVAPAQSAGAKDKQETLYSPGYVLDQIREGERISLAGTMTGAPLESPGDWVAWDGKPATKGLVVSLTFRDSAGAKWKRDWAGKLSEINETS